MWGVKHRNQGLKIKNLCILQGVEHRVQPQEMSMGWNQGNHGTQTSYVMFHASNSNFVQAGHSDQCLSAASSAVSRVHVMLETSDHYSSHACSCTDQGTSLNASGTHAFALVQYCILYICRYVP